MEKQHRDEMSKVCLDMMKDMYNVGTVSEEEMREFTEDCFVEEPKEAGAGCPVNECPAGVAVAGRRPTRNSTTGIKHVWTEGSAICPPLLTAHS